MGDGGAVQADGRCRRRCRLSLLFRRLQLHGAEQGETRLDSPIHTAEGQCTADQIELSEFVGPGVKIDVSAKASAAADYKIGALLPEK